TADQTAAAAEPQESGGLLPAAETAAGEAASHQQPTSATVAPAAASGVDEETRRLIHQTTDAFVNLINSQHGAESVYDRQNQTSAALSSLESIIAEGSAAAINPVRSLKNLIAWSES